MTDAFSRFVQAKQMQEQQANRFRARALPPPRVAPFAARSQPVPMAPKGGIPPEIVQAAMRHQIRQQQPPPPQGSYVDPVTGQTVYRQNPAPPMPAPNPPPPYRAPQAPPQPDPRMVRRYQGNRPVGTIEGQQATVAPTPDYITDVNGNRLYLTPDAGGATPTTTDLTRRQPDRRMDPVEARRGGVYPSQYDPEAQAAGEMEASGARLREIDARLTELEGVPGPRAENERRALLQESRFLEGGQARTRTEQGGGSNVLGPVGTALGTAGEWLDIPVDAMNTQIGGYIHERATGEAGSGMPVDPLGYLQDLIGFGPGDIDAWATDPDNVPLIIDAYENGYDADGDGVVDYTGDRAVWELFIGDQNIAQRIGYQLTNDPLNYLGVLGGAGRGLRRFGEGIRAVDNAGDTITAGRNAAGQTISAIGRALEVPRAVLDEPLDTAVGHVLGEAGRVLGGTRPGRTAGRLFQETAQTAQRRINDALADTGAGVLARQRGETITDLDGNPAPGPGAAPAPQPQPPTPQRAGAPTGFAPGSGRRRPRDPNDLVTVGRWDGEGLVETPGQAALPEPDPAVAAANRIADRGATPRPNAIMREAREAGTPVLYNDALRASDQVRAERRAQAPQNAPEPSAPAITPEGAVVRATDPTVDEATLPAWRAAPPTTQRQITDTPWPARPTTNAALRAVREQAPDAWGPIMREVGDEAEALVETMARAQPVVGDVTRRNRPAEVPGYDAAIAEARYRAALDDAIARNAPDVQRPPQQPIRQPGQKGNVRGSSATSIAPMERILIEPWDGTGKLRQGFHSSNVFENKPTQVLNRPEAAARYVEAVDLHARLAPADLENPAFLEDVQDAAAIRQLLIDNNLPAPDVVVVGNVDAPVLTAASMDASSPPPAAGIVAGPDGYANIPTEQIVMDPNRFQPRDTAGSPTGVDPERVQQMADNWSWPDYQPVKLWREPDTGRLILLSGHHRVDAARLAGIDTLPSQIVDGDEALARQVADASNSIRPLTPVEYGEVLARESSRGMDVRQAARRHGIKQSQAERFLKLNDLPEDVKASVARGLLSPEQGAALSDALRAGAMTPAEVQQFVVGPMVSRQYTAMDITNITRGILDRKGRQAAKDAQGSLFGLGQYEAEDAFDALRDLGRDLANETRLRNALRTVARSDLPGASEAAREALEDVTTKVNALRSQLGYQPLRFALDPAADADALYRNTLGRPVPGIAPTRRPFGGETGDVRRWRDRVISDVEAAVFDRPLANGRTAGDTTSDYIDELMATGLDEEEAGFRAVKRVFEEEMAAAGLGASEKKGLGSLWDTFSGALRAAQLYNVATGLRFVFTNFLGNPVTMLIARNPQAAMRALNPKDFWKTYKYVKGERSLGAEAMSLLDEWQLGRAPGSVLKVPRDAQAERGQLALLTRAVRRVGLGDLAPVTDILTGIVSSRTIRDFATAADYTARLALWTTEFKRRIPAEFAGLADDAAARAGRLGLDEDAVRQAVAATADMGVGRPRRLDDLRDQMLRQAQGGGLSQGAAHGFADRVLRDAVAAQRRASDTAQQEVRRVLFPGGETNLDKHLSRYVFFHFWSSRASALYAREAIRMPGLANAYLRGLEELKERAEAADAPPWLSTWYRFAGTPFGLAVAMNPYALISTAFLAGEDSEGQAWWNPFRYTMLNPLIDMAIYSVGGWEGFREFLTGSTDQMAPQIPGIAALGRAATAAVNLGRGLLDDDGEVFYDPTRQILPGIRNRIGIGSDAGDPNSTERQTFTSMVAAEARERGYSEEETIAAMDNPEDPAYQAALDQYGRGQAAVAGYRAISPAPIQTSGVERDTLRRAGQPGSTVMRDGTVVPDALPSEGWDPYSDGLITARELEQMRAYRDATGEWPTPQGLEARAENTEEAGRIRSATMAGSEEARQLEAQDSAYDALGTEEQRRANAVWGDVAFGPIAGRIVIDGEPVTEETFDAYYREQLQLTGDEAAAAEATQQLRYDVADAYLAQQGWSDEREELRALRERFVAEHPEYAAYDAWKDEVGDYPGGAVAWWEATAAGNPSAAAYLEQARAEAPDEDALEGWLQSTGAYLAVGGHRRSVYDEEPPPTNSGDMPFTATAPASAESGGGGSSGGGSSTTDQAVTIAENLAEYEAAQQAYDAVLGEDFHAFGPMAEQMAANDLARAGVEEPREPGGMTGDYIEWAAQQPPGSDTSILAFLAQYDTKQQQRDETYLPYVLGGGGLPPGGGATAPGSYEAFAMRRGSPGFGARVR